MTKEEIAELIEQMPQGMDANDYIHELVNRAVEVEREACAQVCDELPAPVQQEPYGWHTEDHLTDRSATTYSKDVADRWKLKGWPVTPFYTAHGITKGNT